MISYARTLEKAMSHEEWWRTVGSGLAPFPGEDKEEHTKRVTSLAWAEVELMREKAIDIVAMYGGSIEIEAAIRAA